MLKIIVFIYGKLIWILVFVFWKSSYQKPKHIELLSSSMSFLSQHYELLTDRTLIISQSEVAALIQAIRITSLMDEAACSTFLSHLTDFNSTVSSEKTFLPVTICTTSNNHPLKYRFQPVPRELFSGRPLSTVTSLLQLPITS